MARRYVSRPADLKLDNMASVIRYVYSHGVSSKSDIGSAIGVSRPTASALIDELVHQGIIRSLGLGNSTSQGGKRPELFEFNENAGWVIGLHAGVNRVTGILTDLKLNPIHSLRTPLPKGDFSGVLEQMSSIVSRFKRTSSDSGIPILGIGVSVPGSIDPEEGVIQHAIHWKNCSEIPIGKYLRVEHEIPVFVDNDSRNTALVEKWFGIGGGSEVSTFVTLQTEHSLGTGVVLKGSTFLDSGFSFGEFGHTTIKFDGPVCECGNHGCWELYGTEQAFLHDVYVAMEGWGLPSTFIERVSSGEDLSLNLVSNCAADGDEFARTQLELYADHLAVGIVNLVNAFSPEAIVLHGNLAVFGNKLIDLLEARVKGMALPPQSHRVKISYTTLGTDSVALGASAAVIVASINDLGLLRSEQRQL